MAETFSISSAKQRLGEIADRAIHGEQIIIVRKSKLLVLKELEIPEPIPLRPPGYFNDCYGKDDAIEANKLERQSVQRLEK